MMSTLLSKLTKVQMTTLLDLGSADSMHCSMRDPARNGQQHVECLAVIFSGSQNGGKSYCDDTRNPFLVAQGENVDHRGNPVHRVSWKEHFEAHFPRLAELELNKAIPYYLFKRGFVKKSGMSETPVATPISQSTSSSSSSSSFSAMSSPIPEMGYHDFYEDNSASSCHFHDLDSTREKNSTKQLFASGEVTEHYVLDHIRSDNRGYCSLRIAGSSDLLMEFNLDETCSEMVTFDSLPGTHRWMLFKDIVSGNVTIPAGDFVSVIAIHDNEKVTCCLEAITPSDVLQKNTPQLYKVKKDYFRIPELIYSSPISIDE